MPGFPRWAISSVSSRATRRPEIEVSGIAARHSRVMSSTMLSTRNRRPQANWSWTKSSDQRAFGFASTRIGAACRLLAALPGACAPLGPPRGRYGQSQMPRLAPEQDEQPPVAKASVLVREVTQPTTQLRLWRSARLVADHLAIGADEGTGPTLRQARDGLQIRDGFALNGGPTVFLTEARAPRLRASGWRAAYSAWRFVFQRLQPLGVGHVHPAILGLPVI